MRSTFVVACALGAQGGHAWPSKSLEARVWRPSAEGFEYPEVASDTGIAHIQSRDDFGIAMAGGGTRGMALAHGALRALRDAGVLNRTKYLSVSSGSVWFALPLYFQTLDTADAFFGKTLPLDQLTPEALTSVENAGTAVTRLAWPFTRYPERLNQTSLEVQHGGREEFMAYAAEHGLPASEVEKLESLPECLGDLMACLIDHLFGPRTVSHQLWTLLTSWALMHPYHLAHLNSEYCHASQYESTRERLGNRVKLFPSQDVENNLPFLISQDAVLSLHTGTDPISDPLTAFTHENTLMYSGVPVAYSGDDVKSEPFAGLGDLLVEPFATSSEVLEPVPDGATAQVKVHRRHSNINTGNLVEWQAKTTDLFSMYQVKEDYLSKFDKFPRTAASVLNAVLPQQFMWSPLDVDKDGKPITRAMTLGDAGVYDDIGHLPLLRRGVKKIVIFDSWVHHDSESEDMLYTKTAFGAPTGFMGDANPPGCPNKLCPRDFLTVFEPSEFPSLLARAMALKEAGKPAVVRDTFSVLDNKHFGITGGWKVEIVFVFQLSVTAFVAGLPERTREALQDFFPQVDSSDPNTHFDLATLQQYASYLTEQAVLPEILAMLDGHEVLV